MLVIYTGNGKGKTSASVGQCVRALGQGMRVAFAQFMKRKGQAGEQLVLTRLLGDKFFAGGIGFFRKDEERALHRQAALQVLDWAWERLPVLDMLILDESLYALYKGLLERTEVEAVLTAAEKHNVHIVLSGRGLPEWLAERADLISSLTEVKHPWQKGIAAQKGIEF